MNHAGIKIKGDGAAAVQAWRPRPGGNMGHHSLTIKKRLLLNTSASFRLPK